ncbi:tetratricopeptide repeat protein [Tellurirhabdus rosea]|uniref:tetratricopeptide repeat protein n=1 Tax=Tellurirhabdus rosea TaxID=2674997 RepID=UPI00225B7F1C|nr:tetratricopeptide repeat protein [Tellurirhabdus rosea]
MEVALLCLLFIPYLVIRYYFIDHDTPAEKDLARFAKGIRLIKSRQYDDALLYFDKAVKENPKSAIALAMRGKCHLMQDNPYSALYDITQALALDNTFAESYLDRGMAFYTLGHYQESFLEFDKGVWFTRGQDPNAYRWRALSRIQLQQIQQAENDLRRAVNLGDENSVYLLRQPPFTRAVPSR